MRRLLLLLPACLVLGCGGSDSPAGVEAGPATVSIDAGDAQSAAPGQATSAPVVAMVRDGAGRAVAGVRVTFVVTAGGGQIANGTATTDVAGKANAGVWTLGPSGEQRLEARVGSLSPAAFRASVVPVPAEKTLGPDGGSVAITDPARPLVGTRLTIPAGTFTASGSWRLTLSTDPPPSLPQGFTAVGPALTVETDQLRGRRLMRLRFPIARRAGSVSAVLAFNASGTRFEAMPILASDDSGVTIGVTHLAGRLLSAPTTGATALRNTPGTGASAVSDFIRLQGVSITLEQLGLTKSILDQALNGWPAPDPGSYQYPNGHGPAVPLMTVMSSLQNRPLGNLVRSVMPFGTLADTAAQATLAIAAARFQQSLPVFQPILADLANAYATLTPLARDELTTLNLQLGLLASNRPQLTMFGEALSPTGDVGKLSFAAMIGSVRSGFTYTTPVAPTTPQTLTLGATGFSSRLTQQVGDAPSFSAQMIASLGLTLLFPIEDYADLLPQLRDAFAATGVQRQTLNATLAAQARWPEVRVQLKSTATAPWLTVSDTVIIRDTTAEVRTICTACPDARALYADPQQQSIGAGTASGTSLFRSSVATATATSTATAAVGTLFGSLGYADLKTANVFNALGFDTQRLMAFAAVDLDGGVLKNLQRALVPLHLPMVDAPFTVRAPSSSVAVGSDVVFSAPVAHPPATGWAVEWDWNDGSPVETIRNQATATHKFTTEATRTVRATLRQSPTAVGGATPLAVATTTVLVQPALPVWKFTSMTIDHQRSAGMLPGIEGSLQSQDIYRRDSLAFDRMRGGVTPGAIYLVTAPIMRTCADCGAALLSEGVYLLESTVLDRAALKAPVIQASLTASWSVAPQAPAVVARPLGLTLPLVESYCASRPGQFFTRTGDATIGRVSSQMVRTCGGIQQHTELTETVDLTITGDTATGVLTKTFDVWSLGGYFGTKTMRVTFTAARIP